MQQILRNWDIMRIIRLALGIYVVVEGIRMNQWALIIPGAVFSLMPLFNIGCSAGGSCTPRYNDRRYYSAGTDEGTAGK